ncbi:MAG: hypothetical protein HZB14_07655 [Actinobacteria bacterium]|nr:hypothetical protein [Actinomycetota bacterium]
MNRRLAIATRLGFREQFRRPLLIVLIVGLPFFFITRSIARTEPIPRQISLPGGEVVLTTMRELHGASMAAITIAFIAGLCGAYVMRSARAADRRLVIAGFRPVEAVLPRLAVLAAATSIAAGVSLAVTALSFSPASWPAFAAGNILVGFTFACVGVLAGALLGQLGATYTVLFLAMLGTGILQNPMFGDGTPKGLAYGFPDYGAGRVIATGAFGQEFHAAPQLGLALAWMTLLVAAVVLVLRRTLATN